MRPRATSDGKRFAWRRRTVEVVDLKNYVVEKISPSATTAAAA